MGNALPTVGHLPLANPIATAAEAGGGRPVRVARDVHVETDMLDTPIRSMPIETPTDVVADAAEHLRTPSVHSRDARAMASEALSYVKSHPAQAIAAAAALGLVTALVIRRR